MGLQTSLDPSGSRLSNLQLSIQGRTQHLAAGSFVLPGMKGSQFLQPVGVDHVRIIKPPGIDIFWNFYFSILSQCCSVSSFIRSAVILLPCHWEFSRQFRGWRTLYSFSWLLFAFCISSGLQWGLWNSVWLSHRLIKHGRLFVFFAQVFFSKVSNPKCSGEA